MLAEHYNEGVKTQQEIQHKQSKAAKNVFKPRKISPDTQQTTDLHEQLPQLINLPASSITDSTSINSFTSTITYSINIPSFSYQTSCKESLSDQSSMVLGSQFGWVPV